MTAAPPRPTGPSSREMVGCALAAEWNLPMLLLVWFDLPVVMIVVGVNCFLWALLAVFWRVPGWRRRRFWTAAWMAVLGAAVLLMVTYDIQP